MFKQFQKHLSLHFEAILFGELHWKIKVMEKIESLIETRENYLNNPDL